MECEIKDSLSEDKSVFLYSALTLPQPYLHSTKPQWQLNCFNLFNLYSKDSELLDQKGNPNQSRRETKHIYLEEQSIEVFQCQKMPCFLALGMIPILLASSMACTPKGGDHSLIDTFHSNHSEEKPISEMNITTVIQTHANYLG